MKTPTCVSVRLRHAGFDWRSPLGLLSKGTPDLRVEWKHGSASGDTQVEDVPNPNPIYLTLTRTRTPTLTLTLTLAQIEECTYTPSWFYSSKLPYTKGV
eukprot:scaffold9119_cov74-Phaeocystis_antarctica.AAC.2